ncbi:hypothetical protein BDP27DRAFT_1254983 [Rhodocollybia butyracea]|uniref:Nucleolar protein 12 n=1 Tax=Rhodocollybia butyracea TaxID=206335 RepID=A0A9P5Q989_9AGAR|nr:hypothetical protein BDP27DRAFT_1254983 [Rhodocollybia butyracea]
MALSSLLLASGKKTAAVDAELDALFKTSVALPTPVVSAGPSSGSLKRKHQDASSITSDYVPKKHKVKQVTEQKSPSISEKAKPKKKRSKATVQKSHEDAETDSEDDDSELETKYLSRKLKGKGKGKASVEDEDMETEEDASSDDDDEEDKSPPVHESLTKKQRTKKVPKPKTKYAPADETVERRNARTIFVGNLSVEVSQKKSLLKAFQRHILSLIPSPPGSSNIQPKIESTRFRSVPFAVPTSTLENDDGTPRKDKPKSTTKARQHDIERTRSWKKSPGDKEEEDAAKGEKQFLTPAQKKKIAFINQEIHASGSSVNAYVVFAHPSPPSGDAAPRKSNLPPPPEVMDPYEAARLAKELCDASEFMERTLRVDVVSQTHASAPEAQGRVLRTGNDVDPKRCVFVGNLDFESKEEDVRVFFEGVISTEKGPRAAGDNESGDDEEDDEENPTKAVKKYQGWVTRVRIIRDKDTLLGKGFAYVQFAERECVDEILALEPGKLKFAKRKLRVERCKTIPGGSFKVNAKTSKQTSAPTHRSSNPSPSTSSIPKGDPNLGAKLAHLSKDERKSVKAADADRMARRLAKKKARMTMAVGKGNAGGVKVQGKDRERDRKPRSGVSGRKGKGHGVGSAAKNKGKPMTAKSLEKRNAKK